MKGEKLERGQSLTSRNGAYTLTLQIRQPGARGGRRRRMGDGHQRSDAERLECKGRHCVLYTSDKPICRHPYKAPGGRLLVAGDVLVVTVCQIGLSTCRARSCRPLATSRLLASDRCARRPSGRRRPSTMLPSSCNVNVYAPLREFSDCRVRALALHHLSVMSWPFRLIRLSY